MVSSVVKVLSSLYSTIGGRRCQLRPRGSWLRPGGRAGGLEAGGRRRMRGCPVFIKAGCDRMVKLRAGNSGPYDNPALMRLMLLVTRGSIIYPHGPGAANANNQKYCKIVPHIQGFKCFLNVFLFQNVAMTIPHTSTWERGRRLGSAGSLLVSPFCLRSPHTVLDVGKNSFNALGREYVFFFWELIFAKIDGV